MLRRWKGVSLIISFLLVMSQHAFAAAGAYSPFDTDTEGFRYYAPNDQNGPFLDADHDALNGYLNGLSSSNWWTFISPGHEDDPYSDSPYGGDWTELLNGKISFDLYVVGDGLSQVADSTHDVFLDIPGEDGTYYYTSIELGALNQWNTYELIISDEVFLQGPNATIPLSANLSEVDAILIRGDWLEDTTETVYLDNVRVDPVPIPAAAWVLGTGLLGLIGIRRKMK